MSESSPSRTRAVSLLWLVVGLGLAAVAVAFPLTNTDIWWHLAAGRWIVAHGGFLNVDPFSQSGAGAGWTDLHWLFQILVYGVYAVGGPTLIVVAKAVVCGAGMILLAKGVEAEAGGDVRPYVVVWLLAALFVVRDLVLARPVILTLLCLAAFFWALERYRARGDWRVLILLPVVQLLWANSQGLFPLGPVILACAVAGLLLERVSARLGSDLCAEGMPTGATRVLAATGVVTCVASVATPYGWRSLALPIELFARIDPRLANIYATNVSENLPASALVRSGSVAGIALVIFTAVVLLSFVVVRRRLRLSRFLIVLCLLAVALMARRNILLLFWLGAPIAALNGAAAARRLGSAVRAGRWVVALLRWTPVAAGLGVGALILRSQLAEPPLDRAAPFRTPSVAARTLGAVGRGGNVFTSVRYGGFLIWALPGEYTPYIDGRLVIRSRGQFADYLGVVDHPERFGEFAGEHDFAFAVLPTAYPDRYLGLVRHLYADPDWRLIATDGTETLFARDEVGAPAIDLGSDAVLAGIKGELTSRYAAQPRVRAAALRNLATLVLAAGYAEPARELLAGMEDAASRSLVARCDYLAGDLDLAGAAAEGVLSGSPDDINSLALLAVIATDRGRYETAVGLVSRLLAIDPYNPQGEAVLIRLHAAGLHP